MAVSRRGRVIAVIGALAIVAAGCGAAATPTPAPTPIPTPTAAPTPTPVDVGAAFLAKLKAAKAGRLQATGSATFGGIAATITGMFESSGADDSASTMTIDIGGTKQTTDSIRIGTKQWSRKDGSVWILDPKPADPSKGLNAYLNTLTTLEDKGVETKGTQQLHHLVPPAAAAITPAAIGLDPSIKDAVTTVDFWAKADGSPAVMSLGVKWSQAAGTTSVPIDMTLDVDLTGFGTPATVTAPDGAWTGFTSTRFGYSMAYGQGWSVTEGDGVDQYLMDGTPYVYVVPQDAAGYSLDQLHKELLAYYEKKDVVAKPDADEAYTLGGSPARIMTFHFKNASGEKLLLVDAITMHGNKGWEVYLLQAATGEAEARTYLDTMLSTFSFTQ